jgi:RNA polymerase sigma-70 factor (ECF subfamily)
MKLHLARAGARFDQDGQLVLLPDQDRTLWNRALIGEAVGLIEAAAAARRPGPYQVEAAIAACHAEAESFEVTDWPQIVALYDILLQVGPTALVRLNRAIAGPEAALVELDQLARELDGYHIFHAARGEVLSELGRREQARAAHLTALGLTHNPAERSMLEKRLFS